MSSSVDPSVAIRVSHNASPPPIQASKLQTSIPTPLRDSIARVADRSDNPFFDKIMEDKETGLLSNAYKAIGALTVIVPVAEFNDTIAVTTDGPKWKASSLDETKAMSHIIRKWMEAAIPAHLGLSFDQNFCYEFLVKGKKRGKGRPRKHPYLVGVTGYCAAKKDGCKTTFVAGFTELSLQKLKEEHATIDLSVLVTGSCIHVKGKAYGALIGKKREEVLQQYIKKKKCPAEFAKEVLAEANDEAFHSSNRSLFLSRDSSYNVAREAKNKLKKDVGLSSCKLANVLLSRIQSNKIDLESRLNIKDQSTDLLGIVRKVELAPNVTWHLWTKGSIQLYQRLGQGGKLILNVDATGGLVNIQGIEGVTDKILHTKVTLSPKYALVRKEMMRDKSLLRMLSPLTVAEMISNSNKGVDITAFFRRFIQDAKDCHPEEPQPRPLMCMTDCSPQLESAALAAFGREGMVTSRIQYGNVMLVHLLHFDKEIADDPSTRVETAKAIFSKLQLSIAIFLKECASHVYRAPKAWMHRNKSSEFGKSKSRFESLLAASFASILRDDRISVAIVRWSVILAMLETERFKTPSFSDTSASMRVGRNDEDRILEISRATAIDTFIKSESRVLYVDSLEDVDTTLANVPDDQHLLLHEPIIAKAKSLLKHSCVYLSSVSTDDVTNKTMGTLRCSVVYGREIVDGDVTAMLEGGFNVGVKLPHNGDDGIQNPLYSPTVAKYLRNTWMKKISLWSRSVVDLVESAVDMEIEGNNQFSEAVFRHVKHGQDVFDHTLDVGQYVLHRWTDCQKSERTFIKEYELLGSQLAQVEQRRSQKKRKQAKLTQDALTQEAEEQEDEPWSRTGSNQEVETSMRNELASIFIELGIHSNKQAYICMSECLSSVTDRNIKVMGYATFNNFMNQNSQSKKGLKPSYRKALQVFLVNHTAMSAALAATAPVQEADEN
jgi:hypothetical protein